MNPLNNTPIRLSRRLLTHLLVMTGIALFSMGSAGARDSWHHFPVADVLDNPDYSDRLSGVSFYFADQPHPKVLENLGEFQTNRKTNAFGKSDKRACEWAFLSALVTLEKRAKAEGGNAVVNIRSNYRNELFVSNSEYRCGAGAIMAGVTLVGDVVRVAD